MKLKLIEEAEGERERESWFFEETFENKALDWVVGLLI